MKRILTIATGCIIVAASVSVASAQSRQPARAQGTVSHEAAWHQCLQRVDSKTRRTGENDRTRTAIFKACMAEMGVRP
jgi:hypothetical protein